MGRVRRVVRGSVGRVVTPHRWRVLQAMALLTLGSALQRWWPMRQWGRALGTIREVPAGWRSRPVKGLVPRAGDPTERAVALAVRKAARRLPWEPSCLAEAFAGQVMLRARGAGGAVVIGLRRPPAGAPAGTPWDAHAWLLGREGAITGGAAAEGFTATTVYATTADWRPPAGLAG